MIHVVSACTGYGKQKRLPLAALQEVTRSLINLIKTLPLIKKRYVDWLPLFLPYGTKVAKLVSLTSIFDIQFLSNYVKMTIIYNFLLIVFIIVYNNL